ncbi:tol-pal system protein YbgF [Thiomicrorhabdus sp.]|uniref:tol-pal system protein YbgF n=1 Tax=Thiomicrorhabdus sp. TaxID=2039724 RepID=UPI0029C629EB|nr:tol-pal system protein YbgF [Thiomicrorhabdus sp.]
MKKRVLLSLSPVILSLGVLPTVQAASLEDRVSRLESMSNTSVILRMNQQLQNQQREIQELHDELDKVKYQLRLAEKKLKERDKRLDQRVEEIETQVDSQVKLPDPVPAVPVASVPAVASGQAPISGSADTSGVVVPAASQSEKMPVAEQSKTDSGNEGSKAPATSVEVKSSGPIKTHPASEAEKNAYQQAFSLMRKADYAASIKAFEEFAEHYPESDLAPNAAYWSGEGYMIQSNYQKALAAFDRVIDMYPDSPKLGDAMLRSADSLNEMQRFQDAKKRYLKTIEMFPKSRAAANAEKRLQKLQ